MRITDLDDEVMELVCKELRRTSSENNVFILGGHDQDDMPYRITSTKLVELRNPEANRELRNPLLVFIPVSLRTSAEDSFGVATFEEISFTGVYQDLIDSFLSRIPATLVGYVRDLLGLLSDEEWQFADDVARVRYLLTAAENGIDGETLGASLYELSLIPDFRLFADPALTNSRLRRNLSCVRNLMTSHKSVRGRIADLGLSDRSIEPLLFSLFEKYDVQEPEGWASPIATEKIWWSISFDKWKFQEELSLDKVQLTVLETDLPVVEEHGSNEQLSELIGQQVLIPNDRRKMNVVFEVKPHPGKVSGLDHFTVQIISQNDGPVGKTKKVKAWLFNRLVCTVNLAKLNKIQFDEGWHFIRVLPWTADGDPISLDSAGSSTAKRNHESEPFYVLPGGSLEEEPPQRAIPIEQSLEHARFRMQLTALGDDRDPDEVELTAISWGQGAQSSKISRRENLLVKFGRDGAVQIPISRMLKSIEQRILAKPKHPSGWRMQINLDTAEYPSEAGTVLPATATMQSFLATREDFFSLIRRGTAELIMQGSSMIDLENRCLTYAGSYLDLIHSLMRQAETTSGVERQQHLQALRNVLAVDAIHIILTDFRGRHREAVLVAPTHPLRSLWLTSWVQLGKNWISKLKAGGKEYIASVRTALLDQLAPSAFPVGIPVEDGRIFTPVDDVNAFWGLYAASTEENSRGLMTDICVALGLPEPITAGSDISGKVIADKIERYLTQHPYVRELSLNIFNPGSGAVIGDALLRLQQKPEYSDLRYDIRLFTTDPNSPTLGEALEALVRPGSAINEAADAFTRSTGTHLFSKLDLAKHSLDEFHSHSKDYSSHISMLLDVFPAEKYSVAEQPSGILPLHGLIQDFHTDFIDDEETGTFWNKRPVVGGSVGIDIEQTCFDLLLVLSRNICYATSAVATSGSSFKAVPVVTLGLDVAHRELICEVHQISDWVFTIDRNMGIEFFDHGGLKNRPDYLIDYVPGTSSKATHNLIISSRSTEELEAMLKPVLHEHGLSADGEQAVEILAYLRSLSGQLALKLISTPTQQAEALGLALARLYLEYEGALSNQIIVPLDAHTDLYHSGRESDDVEAGISLQRTDLALFDIDLAERSITCNLVEVKCYSQLGDFSFFNQLKEKVSVQINQSERILQRHFDPALRNPDRPDRLLKSRELAQILRFYLERSERYGIFDAIAAQESEVFLQTIEYGYSLQFRRSALIFDFEKNGTEPPTTEVGIEFHRIGKDLIHTLLENCRRPLTDESKDQAVSRSLSEQFIPSVPKLETAAFIAPQRERSTAWTFEGILEDKAAVASAGVASSGTTGDFSELKSEDEIVGAASLPIVSQPIENVVARKVLLEENTEHDSPRRSGEIPEAGENTCSAPSYDLMLGVNGDSPQYGLLGEVSGRMIALDLNHTHTISLFGVQGGGKSYTLGAVVEMALVPIQNINSLPRPLATVIFHYSPTQDYAPEFTSMIHPNTVDEEIRMLRDKYHATPGALKDILILTPASKVADRISEYPDIEVRPIAFSASELKAAHWKFLMGAIGSQSMYLRQINLIMRGLRNNLTLQSLEQGIDSSGLPEHLKTLCQTRLKFASEYIDDSQRLQDLIRPGRLIIVDLRDEYIEKDEALGLFVVMLQIFSEATYEGSPFNKLVVFDEAHKYIENDDLISGLVEVVREMRHKGTSIMVASQDPPSVPVSLIELSSQIILHKFNSPAWLKHIQKANAALGELTSEQMTRLATGEAYIWSSKASDDSFTRSAVKIKCRPRLTQHGGSTKTAVGD